jgi:hypothetical protein
MSAPATRLMEHNSTAICQQQLKPTIYQKFDAVFTSFAGIR